MHIKKYFLFFVIFASFVVLGVSYYKYNLNREIIREAKDVNLRNFNRYSLKSLIFTQDSFSFYLLGMQKNDPSIKDELLDRMGMAISFYDVKSSGEDICFADSKNMYGLLYDAISDSENIFSKKMADEFKSTVEAMSTCILESESKKWLDTNRFLSERERLLKDSNDLINYLNMGTLLLLFLMLWLTLRLLKIEKELKKQNIELENILDTQSAMVVITNGKEMLKCNKKTMQILGFKDIEEFLKGHYCINEFFKRDKRYLQKVEDGLDWISYLVEIKNSSKKDMVLIYDAQREENRVFKIEIGEFFVDDKNLFVVVFTDVTEIITAKENIELFNETLMAQVETEVGERVSLFKEKAEQEKLLIQQSKMAMMGDMMAGITHQWRQPLSSMHLLLQMHEDDFNGGVNTKENFENFSESMKKQISFMIKTIDDFRNFFKPSKQKVEFYLANEIKSVIPLIAPEFRILSIAINTNMDESLKVFGYPNELKHVILNIFSNAKDALLDQKIETKRVSISLVESNNSAILSITDNGGGIPSELLPDKLFSDYISTKGKKGTGIGLSLAKLIIEKNFDGRISARNIEDGACFEIVLPISK